jgi:hypothetical protein
MPEKSVEPDAVHSPEGTCSVHHSELEKVHGIEEIRIEYMMYTCHGN